MTYYVEYKVISMADIDYSETIILTSCKHWMIIEDWCVHKCNNVCINTVCVCVCVHECVTHIHNYIQDAIIVY